MIFLERPNTQNGSIFYNAAYRQENTFVVKALVMGLTQVAAIEFGRSNDRRGEVHHKSLFNSPQINRPSKRANVYPVLSTTERMSFDEA